MDVHDPVARVYVVLLHGCWLVRLCLCPMGPARCMARWRATSTVLHVLQLIHPYFGHDHNIVGMDMSWATEMPCRDHVKDCEFLRNSLWQKNLPTHQVYQ